MHTRALISLALSFTGCFTGCTCDAASESSAPSEAPRAPVVADVSASDALVTGHTGLGGWSLAGGGSTLFFDTEHYEGGTSRMAAYWLDLASETSRPVRIGETVGALSFDQGSANADGRFALIGRDDGLHRFAREGAADVAFPESERRSSAFLSPSGTYGAYFWENVVHVRDFARGESHEVAFEPGHDTWLLGFADDDSMRVKIDDRVEQVTVAGGRTELCADCSYDRFGGNARLKHHDDGSHVLITPEGERALPSAIAHGLAPGGTVLVRITVIEGPQYEYTKHLVIEGLNAPIDRPLPPSLDTFGTLFVADNGVVVTESAIGIGDARMSCLVVLQPSMRVVACEPCDDTRAHCR